MRITPLCRRVAAVLLAVIVLSCLSLAGRHLVMPVPREAKTYPAHDQHPNESITVAVDPYETAAKASIFSVHYNDIAMLPLFVIVTNDGDQPVSLTGIKAQLVTGDGGKSSPAIAEDVYRRLSRPRASAVRSPLPFPTKRVKGGVSKEAQEEFESAQFAAKAVEPHSSQAGFLFFDVEGLATPLVGARFYLTGVRDSNGNETMYFEVPLDKYVNTPQTP
jgi:hypothetical protein